MIISADKKEVEKARQEYALKMFALSQEHDLDPEVDDAIIQNFQDFCKSIGL